MKTSERVMWLLIGAAVGAGIALLYAPRSGKDTRKLIRRKAEDTREAISDTTAEIREKIVETGETIAEAGRGVYRRGAEFVDSAADLFETAKRTVRTVKS